MGTREQFIDIAEAYQTEINIWSVRNFDDNNGLNAIAPMMGIVEEVGELYHARLKDLQGIRKPEGCTFVDDERDAIGDILVYLFDYCGRRGHSLPVCFLHAWGKVRQRDWVKYPETGMPPDADDSGERTRKSDYDG